MWRNIINIQLQLHLYIDHLVFEEVLQEMSELNCNIIIDGDFNRDWCEDGFYKNKMHDNK